MRRGHEARRGAPRRRGPAAMTAPVAHAAVVELCDPPPPEVAVGASMVLTVRLTCPAGCDLSDAPLTVTAPDGVCTPFRRWNRTQRARAIALTAPRTVGAHVWRVCAAPHEAAGIRHEPAPLAVAVRTRSQETSLAVWAMPSPVVTGQSFAVKVGAKSAAGCELAGCKVEIRDQTMSCHGERTPRRNAMAGIPARSTGPSLNCWRRRRPGCLHGR